MAISISPYWQLFPSDAGMPGTGPGLFQPARSRARQTAGSPGPYCRPEVSRPYMVTPHDPEAERPTIRSIRWETASSPIE
jgi:hypothetical protein